MNLTTQQRRILMAALQTSGASIEEIARISKAKVRTARYVIEQFQTNKILQPCYQIRLSLLNLRKFRFYFTVAADKAQAVCKLLQKDPRIIWLAEQTGKPRFEFIAALKDPCELDCLLTDISQKTGAQFKHRLWAIESHFYSFGSRYLGSLGKQILWEDVTSSQSSSVEVSKLDLEILELLCGDPDAQRLPVAGLARKLGAPHSTVNYHIKRLMSSNVLSERMYFLSLEFAKLHQYILVLTLETSLNNVHEKLIDFCHENEAVVCIIRGFGGWDYQIIIQSESRSVALATVDALEERFQGIFSDISLLTRRRIMAAQVKLVNHPEMRL